MATNDTSEKLSKSFLGALKGGGKTREAEKRGSSKLHTVFTPVEQLLLENGSDQFLVG